MVVADFNVQPGCLVQTEQHIGSRISVPADHTDNRDHLIHIRSERRLFPANTHLFYEKNDIGTPGILLHLHHV